MIGRLLARRARRAAGPRCLARACPLPKVDGMSKWCRDHTDAILVGPGPPGTPENRVMAHRLGARRWFLLAEVALEQEALVVEMLEGCLAQSKDERRFNRPLWESPHNGLVAVMRPPLAERVDQLVDVAPATEKLRAIAGALEGAGFSPADETVARLAVELKGPA